MPESTPEDLISGAEMSAIQHGAEQARSWLLRHYGEDLSGREARRIVEGVGAAFLPYLKISIFADMAAALEDTAPGISQALDEQVQEFITHHGGPHAQ